MSSPPPEPLFTPRKEFIRDQQPQTRNTFALLALSSANCVRLYSFSAAAAAAVRRLLEQTLPILMVREDTVQNLCEYTVDGKPWANAKSVATEKLLVDIIALIYQCGYTYLSTIDYGREADDRLAMAFSKADINPPSSRTATPLPPSSLTARNDSSRSSLGEKPKARRIPFALSFSSVTLMRVISPPLHLTPAILQAVRGSWPRGVVSEKKVGENSYEFKLKGYGWFQQDTFATDSLQHILALLTSLDSHSFSLLTSISLTNRSRVKDLWIFTGPGPEDGTEVLENVLNASQPSLKRTLLTAGTSSESQPNAQQQQHRRLATEPLPPIPHSPNPQHTRAATDSSLRPNFPAQPHVLRKPAPRAQIPVSVVQDSDLPEQQQQPLIRAPMPSTISTGVENMTGVGSGGGRTPDVFYDTPPFSANSQTHFSLPVPVSPSPRPMRNVPTDVERPLRPVSDRAKTPPLLISRSPPPSPPRGSSSPHNSKPSTPIVESGPSPPLLGGGAFRDSAFSSSSGATVEIPIQWTGPLKEEFKFDQEKPPRLKSSRLSSTPMFPGGWQPTPIAEKAEDETGIPAPPVQQTQQTTPIHELDSRIESPEIMQPDVALRKSEAALVGIIQSTSSPPPVPSMHQPERKDTTASSPGGKGWVLVNVDNNAVNGTAQQAATNSEPQATSSPEGPIPGSPKPNGVAKPNTPVPEQASPAAKAIVIIDAMESKHKKSQSASKNKEEGSSGLKRFFSLSRKNSVRGPKK
ncbi:unnamed protein product [Cyclocybe aegerita]|uniref:Uncharacterized protein n=1 Tax=Cyclocybe aegerita TaxID=1973307 RepID=A0A8S0WE73_CYCAE|nr:unnamed protein product [Cyclocybe aegerita]